MARHKTRVETQTEIDDGEQFEKILLALGFLPSFRYEKFRAEWSDGKGHVVLDETPIGFFGEIEGPRAGLTRPRASWESPASHTSPRPTLLFFAWKRRTRSPANEMTFRAIQRAKTPD